MTTTQQSTGTTPRTLFGGAIENYRAHRSARADRVRLERELSTYRTPAEISELDAILERSGDVDPMYTDIITRIRLRAA